MTKIQWPISVLSAMLLVLLSTVACSGPANAEGDAGSAAPPATGSSQSLSGTLPIPATGSAVDSGYNVPASSIPDGESRLFVKYDGVEGSGIPIRNGAVVQLPGGLNAEIFVDPYPTNSLTAWLDLYVERDGVPVTDAETVILYDMWSMGHGPYTGNSDAATDGHHVFRLDYVMFGAWEQVLEIRTPDSDEAKRLTVIIVAVP